jgi:hypothetical protein
VHRFFNRWQWPSRDIGTRTHTHMASVTLTLSAQVTRVKNQPKTPMAPRVAGVDGNVKTNTVDASQRALAAMQIKTTRAHQQRSRDPSPRGWRPPTHMSSKKQNSFPIRCTRVQFVPDPKQNKTQANSKKLCYSSRQVNRVDSSNTWPRQILSILGKVRANMIEQHGNERIGHRRNLAHSPEAERVRFSSRQIDDPWDDG